MATDNESIPPFSLLKQFNPIVSEWARQRGRVKWAFALEPGEIKTLAEISLRELDLH